MEGDSRLKIKAKVRQKDGEKEDVEQMKKLVGETKNSVEFLILVQTHSQDVCMVCDEKSCTTLTM